VTSGLVGTGWTLEGVLGFLLDEGGSGRRALYECAAGGDGFLSLDRGCEGRPELGLSGFLYSTPPGTEDVVPVYRCRIGGDHFASRDPGCEGQVTELQLGYLRRTQELVNRAYNPSTGTHWVTTGPIGPGWFFEFALGYALTRDGGDRAPFFGCLNGGVDHFVSLDPGCEGRASQGRDGGSTGSRPPACRPRRCTAAGPGAATSPPSTPRARARPARGGSATSAPPGPSRRPRRRRRPSRCA